MKKNKAIFLDRDGTINVEKNYLYKIEDFEFEEGVVQGLKRLQKLGFKLIIISNQSGIARGYYTLKDAEILFEYLIQKLKKENIIIEKYYYCPHYQENCECRKPKLALFYQAEEEFNIDFSKSYAIGDKLRDVAICKQEPVKGFLITDKKEEFVNIECCNSFIEVVYEIEKKENIKNGNSES